MQEPESKPTKPPEKPPIRLMKTKKGGYMLAGNQVVKMSDGTKYLVQPNGSWRKLQRDV